MVQSDLLVGRRLGIVIVLRPIEVRGATLDEVPTVAAALADAMMNDPVFTFLRPGRWRREARLQTMFAVEIEQYVLANGGTVWTTSGYDGAVAELPPDGWEMPKSMTLTEAFRWMRAFGARFAARSESSVQWNSDTYESPTSTCGRSACAPRCKGRAWERR